jgi:hypothetical protein
MLEQRALLFGPWQPAEAGVWTQPVLDRVSRQRLGFVRHRTGIRWPLLRWLGRETLEVFETEDASLLCSVHRPRGLSWCWEVRDADERRVGQVYRRLVLDGVGRRLALVVWPSSGSSGRFLTPQDAEIGTFARLDEGTCLTFAPALDNSPFARMALLGAVLTYETSLARMS